MFLFNFLLFGFHFKLPKFAFVNHRKKKHRSEVLNGAEDEFVTDEIDKVNNGESLPTNVKGVEQASSTPDEAEKVF